MNCANNSDASVKSEKSLCSLNLGVSCGSNPAARQVFLGVRFLIETSAHFLRPPALERHPVLDRADEKFLLQSC
jgi:hypothetical protein